MRKKDFSQIMGLLSNSLFHIFDFDGTIAHTFLHIPNSDNNIVEEAYTYALTMMWRIDYAPELLDSVHGLQNRAPGELIKAILDMEERMSPVDGRQDLIDMDKKSFNENSLAGKSRTDILSDCVPKVKGCTWK